MDERKTPDDPGVRQVDATAMKAFAHPLRMAMYRYLSDRGAATATMLAQHLGESTGQTSYHLRQLERHGFVAEDAGRGTGRERWWVPIGFQMRGRELLEQPGTEGAVSLMLQTQIQQRSEALAGWYHRVPEEPVEWVEATIDTTVAAPMTPEESTALTRELAEVIRRHMDGARHRHADEPDPRARRVRLFLDVFPLATD
mgnify:CR=1 FL=1